MGTQSGRGSSGRKGSGARSRKLINKISKATSQKDYNKAAKYVTGAALKSGGPSFLAGALIAGSIAYKQSQTKEPPSAKKISTDAVNSIPINIKKKLTSDGLSSIASAIQSVLSSE